MSNVKNALQTKTSAVAESKKEPLSIKQMIKAYEPEIAKALPNVITPERFGRIAMTAVTNTPKLAECTQKSFIGALLQAAQLGLEPNTPLGQAYLIPYNSKGTMMCQFQVGYKGLIDLAYRSGEFKAINAQVVYENDEFDYDLGLNAELRHKPTLTNRGNAIAYYAYFKINNGGYGFEVMSKEDVENHARKYSQSFNSSSSPWKSNFDEMAKKTVLKKVLKYAPIKTEFSRGIMTDETVKEFDASRDNNMLDLNSIDYIDVEAGAVIDKDTGEVVNESSK